MKLYASVDLMEAGQKSMNWMRRELWTARMNLMNMRMATVVTTRRRMWITTAKVELSLSLKQII